LARTGVLAEKKIWGRLTRTRFLRAEQAKMMICVSDSAAAQHMETWMGGNYTAFEK
jgi:hypothetical protein